jgi:hypothetical protein
MGAKKRIDYACAHCGGGQVIRDAWAEWDLDRQSWVLSAVFDFAYCLECQRDTKLDEREAA